MKTVKPKKKKKDKEKSAAPKKVAAEDSRIGLVIGGRYRITERLAEGGMGVVYRGERISLGRPVAVKFLLEPFAQNPQVMGRFEREARAMSQLSHPNCVSVIDFGVADAPYIVMDLVSGKTLRSLIDEGPVPMGRSIHIAKQVLAALAHAHNQGIIHRDVKPGNVMLSEATGMGDHVRIFDFGLATLLSTDSSSDLSHTNVALGTPAYMSPEQTLGSKVDIRSDLYSTGIVLFELLSGSKPFFDEDMLKLMQMKRESQPPCLKAVSEKKSYSPELEALVAKAIAKNPDDRFQTAKEFADALMTVPEHKLSFELEDLVPPSSVSSSPPPEPHPEPHPEPPPEPVTPNLTLQELKENTRKPTVIAAAIAVAVLALAGWLLSTTPEGEPRSSESSTSPIAETQAADSPKEPDHQSIIGAALVLLEAKEYEEAITLLRKLQRTDPDNAQYPYTLGRVYFEKSWYKDSLEQYRVALRMDHSLRNDKIVNEHFVAMLGKRKINTTVRYVLIYEVGRPALPYLQAAAQDDPDKQVRSRAKAIAKEIAALK